MTTIAIAGPTRLRLTARGRRVLAAVAAVPALVVLAYAVLSGSAAALASADDGASAGSFETVVVESGDSLWSIAQRVAPAADPRDVVDAIIRLNVLDGATIAVGEQLAVPAEYSAE